MVAPLSAYTGDVMRLALPAFLLALLASASALAADPENTLYIDL